MSAQGKASPPANHPQQAAAPAQAKAPRSSSASMQQLSSWPAPPPPASPLAFSDADFVGDTRTSKSTTGLCLALLGPRAFAALNDKRKPTICEDNEATIKIVRNRKGNMKATRLENASCELTVAVRHCTKARERRHQVRRREANMRRFTKCFTNTTTLKDLMSIIVDCSTCPGRGSQNMHPTHASWSQAEMRTLPWECSR